MTENLATETSFLFQHGTFFAELMFREVEENLWEKFSTSGKNDLGQNNARLMDTWFLQVNENNIFN